MIEIRNAVVSACYHSTLLPEPEQPIVVPAVVVPIQEEVPVVPSFPLWTMVVISAFLLSFALLLLTRLASIRLRSLTHVSLF